MSFESFKQESYEWLDAMLEDAYEQGFEDGFEAGYDEADAFTDNGLPVIEVTLDDDIDHDLLFGEDDDDESGH